MSELVWDASGQHLYETGVDNGVLYLQDSTGAYPQGVVWNGLISASENPSGAEANPIYADNIKYLNLFSLEEFGLTIECYTYPQEFAVCNGEANLLEGLTIGQQARKTFGLSYRTKIGNDVDGDNHGYKIHMVYGCMASPSEKSYQTINDNPEAITFSYEINTTPVNVSGFKPIAHMVADSTVLSEAKMTALKKLLYGQNESGTQGEDDYVEATNARLPLPDEIKTILSAIT